MDRKLALIAQILGLALIVTVLIVATVRGDMVVPGWGGAG